MYRYTYPITRNLRLTTTIESDVLLTTEKEVMTFYDRQISLDDYDQIVNTRSDPGFDDILGYIEYNLPRDVPRNYGRIMGITLRRYEGMELIGENHYKICLGY